MNTRRLNTRFNISQNNWLLARYAFVEERMFATLSGWIWTTPGFDAKIEFGALAYQDALHADRLQRRAAELRPPTEEPLRPRAADGLLFFCNEVANAPTFLERMVGLFRVLKPELLAAYREHLAETDDLLDGPTSVILRDLIQQETEHVQWGDDVLRRLLREPVLLEKASSWEYHLRNLWQAIGGVTQEQAVVSKEMFRRPEPPVPAISEFPARDGRHRVVPLHEYSVPSMGETPNEIIRHLLYQNTYGEMEAEDVLGQLLAHTPQLPWQMRLDLARQMWDEARHAEMSWRRMEELGGAPDPLPPQPPSILAVVGDKMDPLERLVILQRTIEGRVTERHRLRVIYLSKEMNDPITARLFEYIVADERSHIANSGWVDKLVGDDPERIAHLRRVEAEAERTLESMLSRRKDTTVQQK